MGTNPEASPEKVRFGEEAQAWLVSQAEFVFTGSRNKGPSGTVRRMVLYLCLLGTLVGATVVQGAVSALGLVPLVVGAICLLLLARGDQA